MGKEKKADLEQLLNSLVEAWWEPYWIPRVKNVVALNHYISFSKRTILWIEFFEYTLRSLVSKESGLWQFVCEMSAYNNYNKEKWKVFTWKKFEDDKYRINWYSNWWWFIQDYEYRLIESALKDESELEDFLLDNIKV